MSHQFSKIETAIIEARDRRERWVAAQNQRRQEEQSWPAAVEACFTKVIEPGMQKLHQEVTKAGYFAPYEPDVVDGDRVLRLSLYPQSDSAGRKGTLVVTADRHNLEVQIEIEVEAEGEDLPEFQPFTRKPSLLSVHDYERELLKFVQHVMVWPAR